MFYIFFKIEDVCFIWCLYKKCGFFVNYVVGNEVFWYWCGVFNVIYKFGLGFIILNIIVWLWVNNKLVLKLIYNVIGIING